MAAQTGRLVELTADTGSMTVDVTYNDANNAVTGLAYSNTSDRTGSVIVTRNSDGATRTFALGPGSSGTVNLTGQGFVYQPTSKGGASIQGYAVAAELPPN